MSVDLSGLVLAPCMSVWGRPATVTPIVSQPNGGSYTARGVWTVKVTDIILEDNTVFSNRKITYGVRLADFEFAIKEGDWITTPVSQLPLAYWQGDLAPDAVIDFVVDDATPDGQGHSVLTLKRQDPQ